MKRFLLACSALGVVVMSGPVPEARAAGVQTCEPKSCRRNLQCEFTSICAYCIGEDLPLGGTGTCSEYHQT
jgi:hypothetical protein